jgi:LytS/YehU family sensor histidine kinase
VQLIPTDPRGAMRAAEQLAGALRIAIEEQRDLITLGEEWDFVQRYLAIECIRFGDRLQVRADIDASTRAAILPSFALQTLVENAIRHGAAPRVEATELSIRAKTESDTLTLTVADNGAGANLEQVERGAGTGLRRLRERLAWLYGNGARLELASATTGGFRATLSVPQSGRSASADQPRASHDDE